METNAVDRNQKSNAMKKTVLFVTAFCGLFLASSCQQQKAADERNDREVLLKSIAMDDTYHQYRQTVATMGFHVATKVYDPNEIGAVLDLFPDKPNSCDMDREAFLKVKGGAEFYDIDCKMTELLDLLDEKYHYQSLALEERTQVREIYHEMYGTAYQNEIRDSIQAHYRIVR